MARRASRAKQVFLAVLLAVLFFSLLFSRLFHPVYTFRKF
jgi:hypothetical protein